MVPKSVLGSKPIRESKSVFMNTLLKTGSYSFKISSNGVKPVRMVSNRFLWSQNWFLWFQNNFPLFQDRPLWSQNRFLSELFLWKCPPLLSDPLQQGGGGTFIKIPKITFFSPAAGQKIIILETFWTIVYTFFDDSPPQAGKFLPSFRLEMHFS